MKQYPIENLRNVGLIAHGGAGKTSLTEALLYTARATDRLGNVMDGTTVSDYDPEEIQRQVSISASLAPVEWKDHKINFIDTPGYFDFVGEVRGALRVTDAAVIVVCAVSGVEVGTEKVWNYCNEYDIPRAFFINKLDRENANYARTLESLRQSFGLNVAPVMLPIGAEDNFDGVIDLLAMKAYGFSDNGRKIEEREIPAELNDQVEEYRTALIEAVAESDDELLIKYLEGEQLTDAEINDGVRNCIASGQLVPVFCGSAAKNIGMQLLLDTIVSSFPSPLSAGELTGINPKTDAEETRAADADAPFSALVFKTMTDPYVGKLSLFRVCSGVFHSDSQVYNVNNDTNERIGQLFVVRGKNQEPVQQIGVGDIGAVAKLNVTSTGDTLADKDNPIKYAPISFPDPVMSLAAEGKTKGDEEKISSGLSRLVEEDPTVTVERNAETKELILSGMATCIWMWLRASWPANSGLRSSSRRPRCLIARLFAAKLALRAGTRSNRWQGPVWPCMVGDGAFCFRRRVCLRRQDLWRCGAATVYSSCRERLAGNDGRRRFGWLSGRRCEGGIGRWFISYCRLVGNGV